MLVVSRKREEKILIMDGDERIEITVFDISRNKVRLGIRAPKEVKIHTKLKISLDEENHPLILTKKTK